MAQFKKTTTFSLLVFMTGILLYALVLLIKAPFPLRPLSVIARYGFASVIPVLLVIFAVIYKLPGRLSSALNLLLICVLFALTLKGLWESGTTEPSIVNGLFPWQDAAQYYSDAQRLLAGFMYGEKSAMRPFFSGFLSLLLLLSGHSLQGALALVVLIVSLACFVFIEEVRKVLSPFASLSVLALVFLYERGLGGSTLTENLGLALGALGAGLLIQGMRHKRGIFIYAGIFMVSMALNTRPGPFFVLPFLALWAGLLFKDERIRFWKPTLISLAAALLPFIMNSILIRSLSDTITIPFANFVYPLYGLVSGGIRYEQIFFDHPEVLALSGNEHYLEVLRLTWAAFLEHPWRIFAGMSRNIGVFFSNTWYSMFGYVLSDNILVTTVSRFVLYALSLLGVVSWVRKWVEPFNRLVVLSFIGILVSVPFVPPGDAHKLRLYAALLPLLILLPALGVQFIVELLKWPFLQKQGGETWDNKWLLWRSSITVLVIFLAPLLISSLVRPPDYPDVDCPADSDSALMRYDQGSFLRVRREAEFFLDRMPDFHYGQYFLSVHGLATPEEINFFEDIESPAVILYGIDLRDGNETWAVLHPDDEPQEDGVIALCGHIEQRYYPVLYADQVLLLDEIQ